MKRGAPRLVALALLVSVACTSTPKSQPVIAPFVTPPTDAARAAALLIGVSDFPQGWTSSPHVSDPSDKVAAGRLMKCAGLPDSKGQTADAFGREFDQTGSLGVTFGSEAMFFKTVALARTDFASVRDPRLLACVRRVFDQLFRASLAKQVPGATVKSVTLEHINVPHYGDESAGLRFTMVVLVRRITLRSIIEIAGIRKGRAEVTATFTSLNQFFPGDLGTTLLETLSGRLATDGGA